MNRQLSNKAKLWMFSPQLMTFRFTTSSPFDSFKFEREVSCSNLVGSASRSYYFLRVFVKSFTGFSLLRPLRSTVNKLNMRCFDDAPLTVEMERQLPRAASESSSTMRPYFAAKLYRQMKSGRSTSDSLSMSMSKPQYSLPYRLPAWTNLFWSTGALTSRVINSQSVFPKEQTSSLKVCPGTTILLSLNLTSSLGETYSIVPATFWVLYALSLMEKPKSPTLNTVLLNEFLARRMLSGLMSRCRYPFRCILAKKGSMVVRNSLRSPLEKKSFFLLRCLMASARVELHSSMMMPNSYFCVFLFQRVQQKLIWTKGVYTLTMRSSSMQRLVSISLKAWLYSSSDVSSMHLCAQVRWSIRCCTLVTVAQFPLPSLPSSRKSRSKVEQVMPLMFEYYMAITKISSILAIIHFVNIASEKEFKQYHIDYILIISSINQHKKAI